MAAAAAGLEHWGRPYLVRRSSVEHAEGDAVALALDTHVKDLLEDGEGGAPLCSRAVHLNKDDPRKHGSQSLKPYQPGERL